MGLFSRKVDITESYSSPLLVNSDLYDQYDSGTALGKNTPWPSLIKQTVASTIVSNRNLGADILSNLVNGVFVKSKAMYSYGKRGENPSVAGGYVRGLPTSKVMYTPSGSPSKVKAVIEAEEGAKIEISYTVLDQDEQGDLWYEVDYYLLDSLGKVTGSLKTWKYSLATGTYPELDPIVKAQDEYSPYLPIVPIRENNQRIRDTHPELYKTGRHCLRTLGIGYDDLDAAIHDEGNNDLGFLDHAFVVVAVDIATKVPSSNKYLFEFFNKLHFESGIRSEDYLYWEANVKGVDQNPDPEIEEYLPPPPPINRMEISDGTYRMVLGWKYISRELVSGSIGKKGTVTKEYTYDVETSFESGLRAMFIDNSYITLRKQVTATEYIELKVVGLLHTNYVGGREIQTNLALAFTRDTAADKNNFIIPIRMDIVQQMGAIAGHDLMYDSVRLVVNSHKTQKLKWYQTGLFKVAVVIAAVAVSIFTAGAGTPLISAAMATIVMSTIATTVALMVVVDVGMKLVEDIAGPEAALVVAVVAAVVTGDFSKVTTWANVGVTVASGVDGIQTMDALEDINNELKAISEDLSELEVEEALREADMVWVQNVIEDTSYILREPSSFLKKAQKEESVKIDLAMQTHFYVDSMKFLDKPYSHIKLGLKPNQA